MGDCEHPVDDVDRLAVMLAGAVERAAGRMGLTARESEAMRAMLGAVERYMETRGDRSWRRYDG